MCCSEDYPNLARYFRTRLAVVEVRQGEDQEDAWRRHLAANPEADWAHVKIFHYPGPSPLSKPQKTSAALLLTKKENLS